MKNIYLVRHCKAVGQEPEAELTNEGEKQAQQLADLLLGKGIEQIISSPYVRAIDSVKQFSERVGLKIGTDERLKERVLSGKPLHDWMNKLNETFEDLDLKFAGGESSREAMNRGVDVLKEALQGTAINIVVVTHGALMSLIFKYFNADIGFKEWRNLTNPDVYSLNFHDDGQFNELRRIWT